MKSWSLKSIFVYQSSAQKPQWGDGRSQHVYLIALFYIRIHVRSLPGWCVVKKPKVLIPTHYSSLVNPNCSCWWADRKKTDGKKLPSCILGSHSLCWDISQTLQHSCCLLSCSLTPATHIFRPNVVRSAFTVCTGSIGEEKVSVRSDRLEKDE